MKKGYLQKSDIRHELTGLLVMIAPMLGVAALRYALFLPQYIH